MADKMCPGGCGNKLDPNAGVGTLPGTNIVVCAQCYKDAKNKN